MLTESELQLTVMDLMKLTLFSDSYSVNFGSGNLKISNYVHHAMHKNQNCTNNSAAQQDTHYLQLSKLTALYLKRIPIGSDLEF